MPITWPEIIGINWRFDYDPEATYAPRDAVHYGGSAFYTMIPQPPGWATPDPDVTPDPGNAWHLLSRGGDPGSGTGHIIRRPDGTAMTDRAALRFIGFTVTNNAGSNESRVTMPPPAIPSLEELEGIVGTTVPFIDLPLTAAFTHADTDMHAQLAMDRAGVVWLRGRVHAEGTGEAIVARLDPLYRPANELRIPVVKAGGVYTFCRINPDGNVYVTANTGDNVHLDGVAFPSDLGFGGLLPGVSPDSFVAPWEPTIAPEPTVQIRGHVIEGRITAFSPGDSQIAFTWPKYTDGADTFVGYGEVIGSPSTVINISVETYEFDADMLALRVAWPAGGNGSTVVVALAGKVVT
jgi:hypothetical protein